MKVVFLGCNGVVNRELWTFENGKWILRRGSAEDGIVNDTQSVQWISEFCEKHGFEIVFLGTWKNCADPEKALRQAGLRDNVKIMGQTDFSRPETRQIYAFLSEHRDIDGYLIFEDPEEWDAYTDITEEYLEEPDNMLTSNMVQCSNATGFGEKEYFHAQTKVNAPIYVKHAKKHISAQEGKALLESAVDLLFSNGYISTSLLQRKLLVGYGMAAKITDKLEEMKIAVRTNNGRLIPAMEYEEAKIIAGGIE